MANVSRTIDIIFNGDDQVTGATKSIVKGIKEVDKAADFTVDKLDMLSDKFKTLEIVATALGVTLGTLATTQFKKFESAWIDLDKIIDPVTDNMQEADDEVQRLAMTYGTSVTEITRNTIEFKRAGFSLVEALTLVEGGLQLASAGNVEMATSTEFIIAIMKGFNLELSDSKEVINTLNVLSDKYATNVEELGIAMSRIAPTAKTAGLSLRETASLAVPIIEVFRSGEEAGTALRRGLIKLTDDAKPVQDALKSLGVQQRDSNGELRSGRDILYSVAESFGKATESNKLFIASQLFGQRQAAKMIKVLDDWNYVMSIQSVKALNDFSYTTDQVAKKLDSTEVAVGRVVSAIELISIRLGQRLKPAIDSSLSGVSDILVAVSTAIEEGVTDSLLSTFKELGMDLGEYFRQIAEILPDALSELDYSGLTASVKRLLSTINASFDILDLTTPEGLAAAIQLVIRTIESGIDITAGMVVTYGKVKDVIIELIQAFNSLDIDQKQAYGSALATADIMEKTGKILGLLITQIDSFGTIAASGLTRVSGLFTLIKGDITLLTSTAALNFTGFAQDILQLVDTVTFGLSETVANALSYVTDVHEGAKLSAIDAAYDMTKGYNQLVYGLEGVGETAEKTQRKIKALSSVISDTPTEIPISITVDSEKADIDKTIANVAAEIERVHKQKAIDLDFQSSIELDREAKEFIDFVSGTGAYAGKEIGVFTDQDLKYLETRLGSLRKELSITTDALADTTDKELEVPDDTKFKAEQQRLLKEIDTNADIMEAKIKGFADITKSEADTITASFESISDSMNSTGDVLTELYRQMSSAGTDIFAQQAIQRKVTEEERRREEAFELQKQLTTAQIDLIKQRAASMAAGDPIITVSGDGLQPHLENIMWELFGAIKIRINETYGNMLLGIGAS